MHIEPGVLLLHGQPGSPADWRYVAAGLRRHTVIAPDRPGYGDNPEPATGFAGNAAWALTCLDDAGIDEAIVVGHSWAGGIALEMAAKFPSRIAGIVLVSSVGPGAVTGFDRAMLWPGVGRIGGNIAVRLGGAAFNPRFIGGSTHFLEAHLRSAAKALAHSNASRRLVDSYLIEQRATVRELPGVLAATRTINAPSVIIHAADDALIPIAVARALSGELLDSRLVELDEGAHFLPHRQPAVVVSAIVSLL